MCETESKRQDESPGQILPPSSATKKETSRVWKVISLYSFASLDHDEAPRQRLTMADNRAAFILFVGSGVVVGCCWL